jgi:hypothetical protein
LHRFGSRFLRRGKKNPQDDEVVVDTTNNTSVDDPTSPTSPMSPMSPISPSSTITTRSHPHKARSTRGTEHQWKWKELFTSVLKKSEYRPALNIEHYSERLGLFAIVALGEGVSTVYVMMMNASLTN